MNHHRVFLAQVIRMGFLEDDLAVEPDLHTGRRDLPADREPTVARQRDLFLHGPTADRFRSAIGSRDLQSIVRAVEVPADNQNVLPNRR